MNKTLPMSSVKLVFFTAALFISVFLSAQTNEKVLKLDEVIQLAREQSPDAMLARHRFRASYWQYRTFIASRLPSLTLEGTIPEFNRTIAQIQQDDGTRKFVPQNYINTQASGRLKQNIELTGGNIFINSRLQRIDQLGVFDTSSYLSTPVSIGFTQPLFSYNSILWAKRIEPLRYEESKKTYVSSMEQVSIQAIGLFFDLALAQMNLEIARINYENTDTLYKIAQGRFNIGTIAENELLQMELQHLNADTRLNEANIDLEFRKSRLRSFLGFNEQVSLRLIIPTEIPVLQLEYNRTLALAMENNPDIIGYQRQLLEARQQVAQAKGERGFSATLNASYGLTQSGHMLKSAYANPLDEQMVSVGVEIPILDWGQGRGRVKMARSSQEVVKTQIEQEQIDFQQNIYLQVMQFNLQDDQLRIAGKADTIGQKRYEVTKQRFLIGKIDVLDMNVALTEKDEARRQYVEAMRNYWNFLYNIRKLTLYDFVKDAELVPDEDYDMMVK